jgi:N-methylhydantoinase A
MYRIGIDVGGTFTDVVAIDGAGKVVFTKAASTPEDPSIGVSEGLARLAKALGCELSTLLQQTERIVHGTTVATNALLERKGAKLGLLTTEGHRDVIEMREGLKDDRYNLRMPPPQPLVPRSRRMGVRERVRADGGVEVALNERSLQNAITRLKLNRVDAVAVCYLHAYRNPRHEKRTRTALARALPGVYVSLSSEILPQIKEYERVSTTVVNASVGPVLSSYFDRLRARLHQAGYQGDVLVMQSHGGVIPINEAAKMAAGAVLSGPAGGVAAGRYCGRLVAVPNWIAFDMGGTSTDVSLIVNGEPQFARDRAVAGYRVSLPSIDIASIGAGGGSIARVNAGGILCVGPSSTGADPGPACYGKGGGAATVTDANLVLGYLDPGNFQGGERRLDTAAAERAIDSIADQLGNARLAAASGIHQIVNTTMAEAIRLVSVRRGIDPRRFALLAFGGAAGLHITDVARRLEIRRVVLPRLAAVLSAWGMLATDLRYEVVRTHIGDALRAGAPLLRRIFRQMETEGRRRLHKAFQGPVRIHRALDMRYGEQIFEIGVPVDDVDLAAPDLMTQVMERFYRRHEELYTYSVCDQDVVLVNARVAVVGQLPGLPEEPALPSGGKGAAAQPRTRRRIYLGRWQQVPVFDLDALASGQSIQGPAIIEASTTTILLRQAEQAKVTSMGWLDIGIVLE